MLLRRAARVAIVVPTLYYFVVYVLGMPAGGPYAVFGSFVLLAFSDFGGPLKDRFAVYLVTTGCGLIAILVGTLVAYNVYAAVISTFLIGLGLTYASVLRGYVATANISVLLPFVIAATSGPGGLPDLPQRLASFAIAGVVAAAAAVFLWPLQVRSSLRRSLANLLAAAANVLQAMWLPQQPNDIDLDTRVRELGDAHKAMREQYDGRLIRPGGATARDRALMLMIDQATRLRIILGWRPTRDCSDFMPDQTLAQATVATLNQTAAALKDDSKVPQTEALDEMREEHRLASIAWASQQLRNGKPDDTISYLRSGFHLRLIAVMSELVASHARVATGQKGEDSLVTTAGTQVPVPEKTATPLHILRSQFRFSSPWLRNSLRSGLALSLAVLFVYLSDVQHGFWVVLGTLTALRFDALGTGRTAVQAILGTAGGFVVGTIILFAIGDHTMIYWILLPIACFLSGYTPGAISLAVGQGSFTVMVIVFYGIVSGPKVETGEIRVLDVAIGLTISLLVSAAMWPRGVTARVSSTLQEAVHGSTALLIAAFDRVVQGPIADTQADFALRNAQRYTSTANETFDLAIAQSGPTNNLGAAWSFISNAAEHIRVCAGWVIFLSRIQPITVDYPGLAEEIIACAHLVQTKANSAVDDTKCELNPQLTTTVLDRGALPDEYSEGSRNSALGGIFQRLDDTVHAAMNDWAQQASETGDSFGDQATAVVWAQGWLVHNAWIATQMKSVMAEAAVPEPVTTS